MSFPSVPSVEEVSKWKRAQVLTYLQSKKDELDLDDEDLDVIRTNKVAGRAFLELTADKLMRVGLTMGPAESIEKLIRDIKSEGESKHYDCVHLQPTQTAFAMMPCYLLFSL